MTNPNDVWEEGYWAGYANKGRPNPYDCDDPRFDVWDSGYACGQKDRWDEMV